MSEKRKIPIGIEDFKELVEKDCCFADKTLLIKAILDSGTKVSLFTRPRRFGKTLNMSMLRYFFDRSVGNSADIFKGLKISAAGNKYLSHMGQYPVISLSLKSMECDTYEETITEFIRLVSVEFRRHKKLLSDLEMFDSEREEFLNICNQREKASYKTALKFLTDCLYQAYEKKVIVLIDEYDVPLQNAQAHHFYDKMVKFIRAVFESVFKTNDSLEFGVLTGCLRVSKESIFTGLNNFDVYSVTVNACSEYFGFTESEVKDILSEYDLHDYFPEVKEWYDGYLFGETEIYNPWSVMKYVKQAATSSKPLPMPYWSHTSSNSIIKELIERSKEASALRDKIETLMNGGSLKEPLYEELTYSEITVTKDSIWSFLLHSGYLKAISMTLDRDTDEAMLELVLPNKEIRTIYRRTIIQWFDNNVQSAGTLDMFRAVIGGDVQKFEFEVRRWIKQSISYHDTKENFYHGFLSGLLMGYEGYTVDSNREAGDGRSDIRIFESLSKSIAVIIEVKPADSKNDLERMADEALKQIDSNGYPEPFIQDGYKKIIKYGAAFFKKECRIKMEYTM